MTKPVAPCRTANLINIVPDGKSSLQSILGVCDGDSSPLKLLHCFLPFGAELLDRDPLIHGRLASCRFRRVSSVRVGRLAQYHLHRISGQPTSKLNQGQASFISPNRARVRRLHPRSCTIWAAGATKPKTHTTRVRTKSTREQCYHTPHKKSESDGVRAGRRIASVPGVPIAPPGSRKSVLT